MQDRDTAFVAAATTLTGMHIQAVRTAPRSPWQNAYVERGIGSIRRECFDHVIVTNETGLRRVLKGYITYYMRSRTHLWLANGTAAGPVALGRPHRDDAGSRRPPPQLRSRRRVADQSAARHRRLTTSRQPFIVNAIALAAGWINSRPL